ncbi:MAG: glycoside hydrolase family 2 TIM barrel-domain containing protein [Alistipes sp.]
MKSILALIALFCVASSTAQPLRTSAGREPIRGEIIAYPSFDEALAAGTGASKYLTPLDQWRHEEAVSTTDFIVPFAWANRQVLLHIASASTDYEIFINNRSAGYNANPTIPVDFNITKWAHEGKNTLEIRLANPSSFAPLESWTEGSTFHLGHVYLLSQPTMRVRDVTVKTWAVEDEMKAEIGIVIRSSALNRKTSRVYYELRNPANEVAASGHKDLTLDMRREDTLRFVTTIPRLFQWTVEQPTQYTLLLKTQYEGRYLEFMRLPLGFRIVEMHDGQMAINGLPTTLHATVVAPTITDNEILGLKDKGYNTLKIATGAAATDDFYNRCDLLGIYVIAQAPLNTRRSGMDIRKGGNPTNNPAWLAAYLERTSDSYHATKRHPSVIAFSLAEQSANGFNLYESYLNMKQLNEVRPFIYLDAGGQWNSDRLTMDATATPSSL